jgi:hypothetical protein
MSKCQNISAVKITLKECQKNRKGVQVLLEQYESKLEILEAPGKILEVKHKIIKYWKGQNK